MHCSPITGMLGGIDVVRLPVKPRMQCSQVRDDMSIKLKMMLTMTLCGRATLDFICFFRCSLKWLIFGTPASKRAQIALK